MAVNPQYLSAVKQASSKYGVPADLLAAQIGAESGWNPSARSPAGAVGISQFMPGTAKGYGIDPTNPLQSIDAQGKMMGSLLKSYTGDVPKALAAYNAGAGAVKKYGGVPPFKETQNYIKTIQDTRSRYPGLQSGDTLPLPSGKTTTIPGLGAQTAPKTLSSPTQGQPVSPFGLTPGALLDAAKQHLGMQKQSQGISFIEQALGAQTNPVNQTAPLPSGGFSSVQVNKLQMSPNVADPKLSPSGQGIVQAALKFKGTPYSWGGGGISGPTKGIAQGSKTTGFDCSSLLQYSVFQATGKKIPRVAQQQYAAAAPVDLQHAKPGDAVFFGTKQNVHHVGIYLGDGKFIEAPHTGDVVKVSTLAGRSDLVGVGRL
jgi:cell wall-associated NlpC family hydrolase